MLMYSMMSFNTISSLMVIIIICFFIFIIVKGIGEWTSNNKSPRLTVYARAAAKRVNVTHHMNGSDMAMSHTDTSYYITFEVESGDRMELRVNGREYGQIAEGDTGRLSFQGTRFLGFERIIS